MLRRASLCFFFAAGIAASVLAGCSVPLHPAAFKAAAPPGPFGALSQSLDTAVANLPKGALVYNTPKSMRVGQQTVIEATVSREASASIESALRRNGPTTAARITVSPLMKADLKEAEGRVEISPQQDDDAVQTFDPSGKMDWKWDVTPTKAGQTTLHLVLSVGVVVPPSPQVYFLKSVDATIPVEADLLYESEQFVSANWQWIASALLIPFGLWVIRMLRARRKGTSSPKSTSS